MSYCASTRRQVYLCPLLCRNTDSYEDECGSFVLCFCVCKIKQKNWIWQGFGPKKSFCCSLLQLLQLVLQREQAQTDVRGENLTVESTARRTPPAPLSTTIPA
jgi:hypothetical protein